MSCGARLASVSAMHSRECVCGLVSLSCKKSYLLFWLFFFFFCRLWVWQALWSLRAVIMQFSVSWVCVRVCVKHIQDFAVIFFPSVFVHNLWRLKYIKHFVYMENSRWGGRVGQKIIIAAFETPRICWTFKKSYVCHSLLDFPSWLSSEINPALMIKRPHKLTYQTWCSYRVKEEIKAHL